MKTTKTEAGKGCLTITLDAENSKRLRTAAALIELEPAVLLNNFLLRDMLQNIADPHGDSMRDLIVEAARYKDIDEAKRIAGKLHDFEERAGESSPLVLDVAGCEMLVSFPGDRPELRLPDATAEKMGVTPEAAPQNAVREFIHKDAATA